VADSAPTQRNAGRATLLVALGACGFATISIFVTLATETGATLTSVLAWRYMIALPVLFLAAWTAGELRWSSNSWRTMILAGLGQSLIALITLSALRYISAATLAFLFYTFPAWVAIIARVRHSEPLTPTRLFALALSLGGIAVMVGMPGGGSLHPIGVALALVGAVIYAAYIPMLQELQADASPVATSAWMSAGAAIILGAVAVARGELVFEMDAHTWTAVVSLALISTALAFLVFLQGLRVLGPVRTAIVSTVEPFFTALLGSWVLDQPMTRATLFGGAMIAAAVILLQLRSADNGFHANDA
jgi:drug/metabolite transporter (DMT)-like permease